MIRQTTLNMGLKNNKPPLRFYGAEPTTQNMSRYWEVLYQTDDLGKPVTYAYDGKLTYFEDAGVFFCDPETGLIDKYKRETSPEEEQQPQQGEEEEEEKQKTTFVYGGRDWILTDKDFCWLGGNGIEHAELFDETAEKYMSITGKYICRDKSDDFGFFTKDKEVREVFDEPHHWSKLLPAIGDWYLFGHHLFTKKDIGTYLGMKHMRPIVGVQSIENNVFYDTDTIGEKKEEETSTEEETPTLRASSDEEEINEDDYENKHYLFFNGHTYLLLEEQNLTWRQARNYHYYERNPIDGRHIITPTSNEENDWIINTIQNSPYWDGYDSRIIQLGMRYFKASYLNRLYCEEKYGTNIYTSYRNWASSSVPSNQIIYPVMLGTSSGNWAAGKWIYYVDKAAALDSAKNIIMLEWDKILTIKEMLDMEDLAKYAPVKKGTSEIKNTLQVYEYKDFLYGVGFRNNQNGKRPVGKIKIFPSYIDKNGKPQEYYMAILPQYKITLSNEECSRFALGFCHDVPVGIVSNPFNNTDYCASAVNNILIEIPTDKKKKFLKDETIEEATEIKEIEINEEDSKKGVYAKDEGGFVYDLLTKRLALFDMAGIRLFAAKATRTADQQTPEEGHDPDLYNLPDTVEYAWNFWRCLGAFEWVAPTRALNTITLNNILCEFDAGIINTNLFQNFFREYYQVFKREALCRLSIDGDYITKFSQKMYWVLRLYERKNNLEAEPAPVPTPVNIWTNVFRNPFKNFRVLNTFNYKLYPKNVIQDTGLPLFLSYAKTQLTYQPSSANQHYVGNLDNQYSTEKSPHAEEVHLKMFGIDLSTGIRTEEQSLDRASWRYEALWIGDSLVSTGIRCSSLTLSYDKEENSVYLNWLYSRESQNDAYNFDTSGEEVLYTVPSNISEWYSVQNEMIFKYFNFVCNGVYTMGNEGLEIINNATNNPVCFIQHKESGFVFGFELGEEVKNMFYARPYVYTVGVFTKPDTNKIVFVLAIMDLIDGEDGNYYAQPSWAAVGTGDKWCANDTDCTYVVLEVEYDPSIINFKDLVMSND